MGELLRKVIDPCCQDEPTKNDYDLDSFFNMGSPPNSVPKARATANVSSKCASYLCKNGWVTKRVQTDYF